MAQKDQLFSLSKELTLSISKGEELVVGDPVESWTDHMQFTDGSPEYEPGTPDW